MGAPTAMVLPEMETVAPNQSLKLLSEPRSAAACVHAPPERVKT
jgi:hypothetical protein